MVGVVLQMSDRNGRAPSPLTADLRRADRNAWRGISTLIAIIPLCLVLVQCGRAPSAGTLAASSPDSAGDTFDERFPRATFSERSPATNEIPEQRQPSGLAAAGGTGERAPYRVASLAPTASYQPSQREDQTTLVSLKSSAFPYVGNNPVTDKPFLNVYKGGRRGHRSLGGRVYWQNETYNDSRVLMHVPQHFDIRKPGVIVVFFHGNGATLERDVRDRQLVPQQISDSGVNAVLLAPQLALDAADSSAGKFWQPGGLKHFVSESAGHLARIYGDPGAAKAFAKLPVIIVGYSGGFMPAAWSLEVGGLGGQVRGVFLLDAVYGELDKFASWIENNRSGVFVSAYTSSTQRHDEDLIKMLGEKGIAVSDSMDGPLRPGSVVFVKTAETASHRDYVTYAWTENPLKDVLVKVAAIPELTKIATTGSSAASR
jgi:hypothetical protein